MAVALSLCVLGCGGGSPSEAQIQQNNPLAPLNPATSGFLTVHVVQDGLPGTLSHLNLVLAGLEVRVGGTWRPVTLATPGQTIDILAATSQSPLTLATDVPWPTGVNDAMRFSMGPNSNVQLTTDASGTEPHLLSVPQQFVSVMGLPGSFSVAPGTDTDLWITFDVENVILPDALNDGGYVFFPGPVRGYDKAATGSITGKVTIQAVAGPPAVPAGPIQGAGVTAQLQLEDGQPSAAIAFRTVLTQGDGSYTLDLLPVGADYAWCVVSQPVAGSTAYYPQATPSSIPILGLAQFNQGVANLAFAPVPVPGTVSGTVSAGPGVGQEDVVDLIQEIVIDGVPYRFVMRSVVVTPAANGTFTFSFPSVPPGIYSAVYNNYSEILTTGLVDQAEPTAPFIVSAGGTTGINF
jgi:hypothetical protein